MFSSRLPRSLRHLYRGRQYLRCYSCEDSSPFNKFQREKLRYRPEQEYFEQTDGRKSFEGVKRDPSDLNELISKDRKHGDIVNPSDWTNEGP